MTDRFDSAFAVLAMLVVAVIVETWRSLDRSKRRRPIVYERTISSSVGVGDEAITVSLPVRSEVDDLNVEHGELERLDPDMRAALGDLSGRISAATHYGCGVCGRAITEDENPLSIRTDSGLPIDHVDRFALGCHGCVEPASTTNG